MPVRIILLALLLWCLILILEVSLSSIKLLVWCTVLISYNDWVVLDGFKLHGELIIALLKDAVRLLECSMLDIDLLEHVACKVVFAQFLVLCNGSIKDLGKAWDNLMDDPLGSLYRLFHAHVLLLKLF